MCTVSRGHICVLCPEVTYVYSHRCTGHTWHPYVTLFEHAFAPTHNIVVAHQHKMLQTCYITHHELVTELLVTAMAW